VPFSGVSVSAVHPETLKAFISQATSGPHRLAGPF
jgi:hypothetical protein